MIRACILMALALLPFSAPGARAGGIDVTITGGKFESVLPPSPKVKTADVPPFRMDTALVSNADFAL